eukprot:CAMPEP_0181325456 /NCGR_PEP_ID=MMETSP1101-20121128/20932_1 /TAXON_ID=46948 /ORGANISM="Rhodomonas abbreviata, Strain Caron Lab Isolate" /LENGTH=90 /DNA_ID=CAMNT_0023433759 /DNA_START=46 /DNA_END=318 /DNA_ORIENTATION=+
MTYGDFQDLFDSLFKLACELAGGKILFGKCYEKWAYALIILSFILAPLCLGFCVWKFVIKKKQDGGAPLPVMAGAKSVASEKADVEVAEL